MYFQKAHANNLKSNVLNFTQESLNSYPIKHFVETNWEIIQRNLCTIMDATVPWNMSHRKRHFPRISLRIKRGIWKTDELHCRARIYQDVVHWDHFRQCRNKVAKMVQKALHGKINHTIGDRLTEQPKSFCSYG